MDISKISSADKAKAEARASGYANDQSIEMAWAIKAYDKAELHMNLLTSVCPRKLVLCELQDEVHAAFRRAFPDLDVGSLSEADLKSPENKLVWREFSETFKEAVEDYNYGTLLRLTAKEGYNEANTILVTRVQFLAVEIARNRLGLNDGFRKPKVPGGQLNGAPAPVPVDS